MIEARSIYERLVDEEDARACAEIEDAACRETPGNFVLILSATFLTKLGDCIADPKTVLPWVLSVVGAPVFLLGLLVPIRESGSLIPQLVIASVVRRMPIRKWVYCVGCVGQAACIGGIGITAAALRGGLAGWTVIALLAGFSLARGLCSVASKDVVGKTVPKGRRGQLTGWSTSAAGLLTVIGGVALLVLPEYDGPRFFGIALVAAATLWAAAAVVFGLIREYPGATDGAVNALTEASERLGLLIEDAPFRRFVITRALLLASALAAPYLVALAHARAAGGVAVLGSFVVASGAASLVSAPVWGRMADRSSRRAMGLAATIAAAAGAVPVALDLLAPTWLANAWLLPGCFFVLSIAHSGIRVGRKTYVVDLASGNRRTDYVAVSNTVIGVILLVVGGVGALIPGAGAIGLLALFSILAASGAVAAFSLPEA